MQKVHNKSDTVENITKNKENCRKMYVALSIENFSVGDCTE